MSAFSIDENENISLNEKDDQLKFLLREKDDQLNLLSLMQEEAASQKGMLLILKRFNVFVFVCENDNDFNLTS